MKSFHYPRKSKSFHFPNRSASFHAPRKPMISFPQKIHHLTSPPQPPPVKSLPIPPPHSPPHPRRGDGGVIQVSGCGFLVLIEVRGLLGGYMRGCHTRPREATHPPSDCIAHLRPGSSSCICCCEGFIAHSRAWHTSLPLLRNRFRPKSARKTFYAAL